MTEPTDDIARVLASARPTRRVGRWLLVLALLALSALGAFVWLQSQNAAGATAYTTVPVTRGPLTVTVTATGTIQPTTQVEVSSELSGTIVAVEADFNDQVEVGQVLARLDDTKLKAQLANAEAALAAAEARLVQAEASEREAKENYDTQASLDRRGITARREFIIYEAAYRRAVAASAIARADLATAEANLTLARTDLAKSAIRSPIAGVVLDRMAEPGQIVASSLNTPTLFALAEDLRRMELRVDIDEADIGRVAVGNAATFAVDAYDGRSFPAAITQIRFAPETTEGVVTYKAVLSVDNADLTLRPGMTATATITVAERTDALLVPNAALRYAPPAPAQARGAPRGGLLGLIIPRPPQSPAATGRGGQAVWVLRDGAPVRVEVTPGDTDGQLTAIVAGDLAEGEAVITDQSGGG